MKILRWDSVEGLRRGFADAIREESVEMFRASQDSADGVARGRVAAVVVVEIVGCV